MSLPYIYRVEAVGLILLYLLHVFPNELLKLQFLYVKFGANYVKDLHFVNNHKRLTLTCIRGGGGRVPWYSTFVFSALAF